MIRNIELSEISDGSLYTSTDMAKPTAGAVKDALPAAAAWEDPLSWIPGILHR